MLNGITVICDGKTRHLELDKGQADRFFWYAGRPIAGRFPANSVSFPQNVATIHPMRLRFRRSPSRCILCSHR
jgi:hypothetical protein